jgi:hypothetical protein
MKLSPQILRNRMYLIKLTIMTKEILIKKLENLEQEVFDELRKRIYESKTQSKHYHCTALKVNIYGYTELVIINDRLTFLDNDGYHYSVDNGDCTLLDLMLLL